MSPTAADENPNLTKAIDKVRSRRKKKMGPELVLAIIGPLAGGAISIFVWSKQKKL